MGAMSASAQVSGDVIVHPDPGEGDADTIQEGIAQANEGETIIVEEGVYNESVVVDIGVTIVANGTVVLDGEGDPGPAFTVHNDTGVSDVTIDGFFITDYAPDDEASGFAVFGDASNVTLIDNHIEAVEGFAIGVAEGPQGVTISETVIDDPGKHGILVISVDTPVDDIHIDNVSVQNATGTPLQVLARDNGSIDGLTVSQAALNDSAASGLSVVAQDNATVTDIAIAEIDVSGAAGTGVEILLHDNASIAGVEVESALAHGAGILGIGAEANNETTLSEVTIAEVALNETAFAGFGLFGHGSAEISNVTLDAAFTGESDVGVILEPAGTSTISGVSIERTFAGANDYGVVLNAEANGMLEDVALSEVFVNDSTEYGIAINAEDAGFVDDVTLETAFIDGNELGVVVGAEDDGAIGSVSLETVIVQNSSIGGIGVAASSVASVAVRESILRDNDGPGLVVDTDAPGDAVSIHHSLIARNAGGIENLNDSIVDARFNWWGHATGPSGDFLDPETGKLAYGDGDSVTEADGTGVANVRFSPAIGGKAEDRTQMVDVAAQADDEVGDIEIEIPGITIDEPVEFTVEGEVIAGPPSEFIGVSVWESSILPLRADTAAGAVTVDLPDIWLRVDDDTVFGNLESVAVYDTGEEIPLDFSTASGATTSLFDGHDVQLVVLHGTPNDVASDLFRFLDEADEFEDDFLDELDNRTDFQVDTDTGEVTLASDNVTVAEIQDLGELEGGSVSTAFTPDEPGDYVAMLATVETGDGFQASNDFLQFNIFNDTVGVIGMESLMVQKTAAEVDPSPSTIEPGDNVTFSAASNLDDADEVSHALVAFNEAEFLDLDIEIEADLDAIDAADALVHLEGEVGNEPFLLTVNLTDDGAFEITFDADQNVTDAIDPAMVQVSDGAPTEELTLAIGELADIDEGESADYTFLYAAVDTANTDHRSFDQGTVTVAIEEDEPPPPPPIFFPPPDDPPDVPDEIEILPVTIDPNTKQFVRSDVPFGTHVTLPFGDTSESARSGVTYETVEFEVRLSSDVDVTLSQSATTPAGVPAVPTDREGLSHLDIDYPEGFDERVDDVVLTVTITDAALAAEGIPPAEIVFYRYDGTTWRPVSTSYRGQDGAVHRYVVQSPGLSVFAPTQEDADIQVVDGALSATDVDVGEEFDVEVTLENQGDGTGTETIDLVIDGAVVDSLEVELAPGETATETFTHSFDRAGAFLVEANDFEIGTVTVHDVVLVTPTPTPTPEPEPTPVWVWTLVFILIAVILAGAFYYLTQVREVKLHDQFDWQDER